MKKTKNTTSRSIKKNNQADIQRILRSYFNRVDDYYEALDEFINDVNEEIRVGGNDPKDAGIASAIKLQELKHSIYQIIEEV